MSNNLTSADPSTLPYYVATYKGRSVAIKRDGNYQTTIELVQKSIPKLRSSDTQDIFISTALSDYGGALVQISEEIWPDVVSRVKTVEITLEGDGDTISDAANVRAGNVVWTARSENTTITTAASGPNVQASVASDDLPIDPHDSLSITVRTPSQTLLELNDLRPSLNVKDVKNLIEATYGMPAALQRLDLLGKPLDDSMALSQFKGTPLPIVDLIVNARQSMICLFPGRGRNGRYPSYENIDIRLSLNRAWELAALRRSTEGLPKDHDQSVSWNIDVAQNGVLTEHGSQTKLTYLFWDGLTQNTQPATPAPHPSPSQSPELSPIGCSPPSGPLLDPRNSVAVPIGEVYSYMLSLFSDLGVYGPVSTYLAWFASQLKQKRHKYLALRIIPQPEYETMAPLSISPPPNHTTRISVLYKGLSTPAVRIWNGYQPSYQQGAAIWKDIAKISACGTGNLGEGYLNVVEISWMEVP